MQKVGSSLPQIICSPITTANTKQPALANSTSYGKSLQMQMQ